MQNRLSRGEELPDPSYDERLVAAIDAAMFRAGDLEELLRNNAIENIDCNGCDEIWITYADERGKVRGLPLWATDEDMVLAIQTLASYAGINARPFTRAAPQLDLRLPDGSRLSAVMSASERPLLSIRRNRFPQMFMSMLVEFGSITPQVAAFLEAAVLARCNIVVAGATDSGKTTLLRAMINCIPSEVRLITVERAVELGLRRHPDLHSDVAELEEVLPDVDGNGGITIRDLVRRTRRMNPSRVIVGEVLGPECIEMLSAMSQGNNGSLSTIHARSADDVFQKLATYGAQYEGLDFAVTHSLIASSLDFIVFVEKNKRLGGRRCITQIVEVSIASEGNVLRSQIFVPAPFDGRAMRNVDVPIQRADELTEAGYSDGAGSAWDVTAAGWE
jgi:pilus assembly protein CpaF